MQGNSATTQDWKPIVLSKRPAGNRTAKSEADAANARASGAAVDTVRRRCVPGLFLCFFFLLWRLPFVECSAETLSFFLLAAQPS
jgi:hypothetical protein